MNNNQLQEANHYLTEFASLMRSTLQQNDNEFTPLSIEIKTLETYIKLEQLRFKFSYRIDVASNINTNETDVPSLLLQPLIENAIKHGVSALQEQGMIEIDISTQQKNVLLQIKDNGKGFTSNQSTSGYGLKLTLERIALLNKMYIQQQIQFSIDSNSRGTTVHLILENWL
jgi:LytS/YehU family sensor histidine kinase